MRYTLRLFGLLPVLTVVVEDTYPTVVYNSGGTFEICPEPVEEGYEYEEEYQFGFRRPL